MLIIPRMRGYSNEDLISFEVYLYNRVFEYWETILANPAFHTEVEHHVIVADSKTNKVWRYLHWNV